ARLGVSYEALGDSKRIATKIGTDPPETETQVIVEPYLVNDRIYATAHVRGGIDVFAAGIEPLLWLDDNRDGRAWAAEFEAASA
ncbi:MAG: hypothetical protein IIB03_07190, partial [Acidobacteria bacterium]|nr:hypothetical protein [Acidobacteriota bacterium]